MNVKATITGWWLGRGERATVEEHDLLDAGLAHTRWGIRATKISIFALLVTSAIQLGIVAGSHSVGLLASAVDNFTSALPPISLWIAFRLSMKEPTKRFTYGYGRFESLSGLFIITVILVSAILLAYESIIRFFHPETVGLLWAVAAGSLVGFVGNEAIAVYRTRVGKHIGSAAMVADGSHARMDGLSNLAVLFSAIGIRLGFPAADPIVGLLFSAALVRIFLHASIPVFLRALDAVDPQHVEEIERVLAEDARVSGSNVRLRWMGHTLQAQLRIRVPENLTISQGQEIAVDLERKVKEAVPVLASVEILLEPGTDSGGDDGTPLI